MSIDISNLLLQPGLGKHSKQGAEPKQAFNSLLTPNAVATVAEPEMALQPGTTEAIAADRLVKLANTPNAMTEHSVPTQTSVELADVANPQVNNESVASGELGNSQPVVTKEVVEMYTMSSVASGHLANSYTSTANLILNNAEQVKSTTSSLNGATGVNKSPMQLGHSSISVTSAQQIVINTEVKITQGQRELLTNKTIANAYHAPLQIKVKDKNLTETKDGENSKLWYRDYAASDPKAVDWLVRASQVHKGISQVAYNGQIIWQR